MEEKINACQTLAELAELETTHSLNEGEQRLVFERRLQIFLRIHEWREENKKLGLEPTSSDTWAPEQTQRLCASGSMSPILQRQFVVRNARTTK